MPNKSTVSCLSILRPRFLGALLSFTLIPVIFTGCSLIRRGTESNEPGQVILRWKADPELRGFNLYRIDEGTESRINNELIKPVHVPTNGQGLAEYEYRDYAVIAGKDYYYIREQVDREGIPKRWETPQLETATVPPRSQ